MAEGREYGSGPGWFPPRDSRVQLVKSLDLGTWRTDHDCGERFCLVLGNGKARWIADDELERLREAHGDPSELVGQLVDVGSLEVSGPIVELPVLEFVDEAGTVFDYGCFGAQTSRARELLWRFPPQQDLIPTVVEKMLSVCEHAGISAHVERRESVPYRCCSCGGFHVRREVSAPPVGVPAWARQKFGIDMDGWVCNGCRPERCGDLNHWVQPTKTKWRPAREAWSRSLGLVGVQSVRFADPPPWYRAMERGAAGAELHDLSVGGAKEAAR